MGSMGDILSALGSEKKPKGSASLAALVSAFVPTWFTAMLFVVVFIIIRHRYPNIYSPRTYMRTIPEKHRTPTAPRSYFDWVHTLMRVPDKYLLYHTSLDAYLYLRFLRTTIFICFIGCLLTWPILMPVNATGGGNSSELDKIGIGNVSQKKRLYAHAVVAWVFFSFVMFLVARERLWLIGLRQAWNLSKPNAQRLSSRTVLFLSAPRDALRQQNRRRYFGDDAMSVWPVSKADTLKSLVSARDAIAQKLEAAEVSFIIAVNKKAKKSGMPDYRSLSETVMKSSRPTHRSTVSPTGDKVDSIEWFRKQLRDKDAAIERLRDNYDFPETHGAAAVFVEFRTQSAAQRVYQQLPSSELLALNPRYIGVTPKEVIWENLTIPPASRISQEYIAHALVAATILFWSVPIALVGAISNITYLAENVRWLSFLQDLPDSVVGLLTGLLPPLLTSALTAFVPNIFRYIARTCGEPTTTSMELKVQKWYYVFQVTQVFLVTTLSSGVAAVASQIAENPTSVPELLAQRLPRASNFYLTYFIVQGLTSSSDNLLNYSDLLSYVFGDYFDKTPRQKYNRYTRMKGIQWGKVYPKFANFAIIAIAYSCIAPLVLGFAAIGLLLYYFSYRYNMLFVMEPKVDTKGQSYTLALQQLLTGVYIAELALLGIFSLKQATGPTVLITLLFIATIVYNFVMNKYFGPFENYLPADLAREFEENGDEQTPLLASVEEGNGESYIQNLGSRSRLPPSVVDPIARFFEPRLFTSHKVMKAWIEDGDWNEDDVPVYTRHEVADAYLNPVFTKKMPLIWLPRDRMEVSMRECNELDRVGIDTVNRGARLDRKGRVKFDVEKLRDVPLLKPQVRY